MKESEELLSSIRDVVNTATLHSLQSGNTQWERLKKDILDQLEPFIYKKTGRRPMMLPIIIKV